MLSVVLAVGLVSVPQSAAAPERVASAAAVSSVGATGSAGLFVPVQERVLDTRYGTGGFDTKMPANTWRKFPIAGVGGLPESNISAVQVTVTVVNPGAGGTAFLKANPSSSSTSPAVIYRSGVTGTISASSTVAVGSDGFIRAKTETTETLLVDVQGYYTADGDTAAGGYVPIDPKRIADSRLATSDGLPSAAKLAKKTNYTIPLATLAPAVPAGASAAVVTLIPLSSDPTSGFLQAWATGDPMPGTSLNFPGNTNTAIGTTVPLAADGTFDVRFDSVSTGGPIHLAIDVVGYFTETTSGQAGAFTPASTRVLDTRQAPNVAVPGNATVTFPIAGIKGVPLATSGISAVAVSFTGLHDTGTAGRLQMWAADKPTPATTVLNYPATASIRNNFTVVAPSVDGKVKIRNIGPDPVNVVLDVFGWYSNVTTAVPENQTITGRYLTLQAGPTGGPWVTYQYRIGTTGTFTDVPVTDVTVPGTSTQPSAWPVQRSATTGSFEPYTWDLHATMGNTDRLVQVQACYRTTATDTNPVCGMPTTVQLGTSGFQNAYATTDIGPGALAELTGDYQIVGNDVDEAAALSGLSLSRTLTTLAPTGEQTGAAGIFGPGWTTDLTDGAGIGRAELALVDQSANGYLTFKDSDGSASMYQATSDAGVYPRAFAGVGDAAADGWTVTMTNATTVTLIDVEGTTTTWSKTGTAWRPATVAQPGTGSDIAYTYNASGLPTRITGAAPAGISCTTPASTVGCRSIELSYTTVTVGGAARARLAGVSLVAADPATHTMTTMPVAAYSYDTNGRLAEAWDPRISPALKTTYTYTAQNRLATLTPPGLSAWSFGYDTTGRLSTVSRPNPGGGTAISTVVYDVPTTGSTAPIDLGATAAAVWGQTQVPATGTAVFGPNRVPASTSAGSVTTADWPWASIDYLDVNGRTTNSAAYGANAWQFDATRYNQYGSAVWSLSPANRAQAVQPTADTAPTVTAETDSTKRADLLAGITKYDPLKPELEVETFGPTAPVADLGDARSHTTTTYDEGAPVSEESFDLPTSAVRSVQTPDGVDHGAVTTRWGYEPIDSGDPTGWSLYAPTTETIQMGSNPSADDLVTTTRYDAAGRVIAHSLPGSSGADARTHTASYYTATGTGDCVNPALTGLTCREGPAAQPATGQPLPTTTYQYNRHTQVTEAAETSGAVTRTTTNTYDTAGRITETSLATTGLTGSTPVPTTTTGYSATSGLPVSTTAGGATLTTGYDTIGRVISYTDATGNTTTTSYDTSGRVATVDDGKATATYTYDTSSEHRGLVTTLDPGTPGGGTFTAQYDQDGATRAVTYPNGLVRNQRYDNEGRPRLLDWTGSGYTFTQEYDTAGRTARSAGSAGDQQYSYDNAGRLTTVTDTQPGTGSTVACTTRSYTFSKTSNRTTLTEHPDGNGGTSSTAACTTSTTPTTTASTFDDADRITTTGYSYDQLGRTLTVPAADAISTGSNISVTGDLTIGYHDNDMAATLTQDGQERSYTLDPQQSRIVTIEDGTTQKVNAYSDDSDNPAWTLTQPIEIPARVPENITWERHIAGPDGLLTGTHTSTGTVSWNITDPQGSIIATTPGTNTTPTAGTTWTEYGTPRDASQAGTYGWLGEHQRSTDTLGGLTLMGVRLYNPVTGRFLTVDAVYGGNTNPYVYPLDPIDDYDLDGKCWSWINWLCNGAKKLGRVLGKALYKVPFWIKSRLWSLGATVYYCADYFRGNLFRKPRNLTWKSRINKATTCLGAFGSVFV